MSVIFRGRPACECLAEWLVAYEKLLLAEGVIKFSVDIYQLIGGAKASAGTHSTGGAYDIAQIQPEAIRIAREMGAAAWARTPAQGFSPSHQHGVLNGCPHNGPARYQIAEYLRGENGLKGSAEDDGPRILPLRTWQEGIRWSRRKLRIARLLGLIRAGKPSALRRRRRERVRKLRRLV